MLDRVRKFSQIVPWWIPPIFTVALTLIGWGADELPHALRASILILGLVLSCFVLLLLALHFHIIDPNSLAQPKVQTRSFTLEQQRKLIELLRTAFPENGYAKLEIM